MIIPSQLTFTVLRTSRIALAQVGAVEAYSIRIGGVVAPEAVPDILRLLLVHAVPSALLFQNAGLRRAAGQLILVDLATPFAMTAGPLHRVARPDVGNDAAR